VLTNREWELFDPADTATEMSVGQQDSIFGDSADRNLGKMTFGNGDEGSEESGTESLI
jgi:hypothetical protein